ncbi:MAG: hypothetical protein OIF48_13235 [Silicimonas sp.]|nr:hypothetical protein [Silicimonas sp.]
MAERWEDYFEPGETLLWQGQPLPQRGLSLGTVALALFGFPFLLAGLAMSGGALLSGFGIGDGLWGFGSALFIFFFGLPFLGAGLGMVLGPWYTQRMAHRKTRYALSDRRAYIATRWWGSKLESYPISRGAIELENDRSVYFHTEHGRDSDGDRTSERKGFENIEAAREVYHLLRQIQDGPRDDR